MIREMKKLILDDYFNRLILREKNLKLLIIALMVSTAQSSQGSVRSAQFWQAERDKQFITSAIEHQTFTPNSSSVNASIILTQPQLIDRRAERLK